MAKPDDTLHPAALRLALRELLRLASVWEAQRRDGARTGNVGSAVQDDHLLLVELVERVLKRQANAEVGRGSDGRVLRQRDLAIGGLWPPLLAILKKAKEGLLSGEEALDAIVVEARGRGLSVSVEDLVKRISRAAKGQFSPTRSPEPTTHDVVIAWLSVNGTKKAAGSAFGWIADRDVRFAEEINAIVDRRSQEILEAFPAAESSPTDTLTAEQLRGLAQLEIVAEARGRAAGTLAPLGYLLGDVLKYPDARVKEAIGVLDRRSPQPPPLTVVVAPERIVLDTGIIRDLVHGDDRALSLVRLGASKGRHAVSISEVAWVELLQDMLDGTIGATAWKPIARQLADLVDPALPVVLTGTDLAALLGVGVPRPDLARQSARAWNTLRDFHSPGIGDTIEPARLTRLFDEIESRWADLFAGALSSAHGSETEDDDEPLISSGKATEERLVEYVTDDLRGDFPKLVLDGLQIVMRAYARRWTEAGRPQGPYRPKRNDALDLEHLFMLPLPCWICTADKKFRNFVSDQLGTPNVVMLPDELLARLEEEQR